LAHFSASLPTAQEPKTEPGLAPLLDPRLEQWPQTAERTLMAAQAVKHWLQHELVRRLWQYSLGLDYCREKCCWKKKMMTMTWGLEPNRL